MNAPSRSSTRGRRRPLAALAGCACALALTLTGCGVPDSAEEAAGWTFTDGTGAEVALPERPERVVAYSGIASVLWDYGFEVVGVFGPAETAGGGRDPQIGDVDLDRVEVISQTYGEMSVERLAALEPDLVITQVYDDVDWYLPEGGTDQIEAVAPLARIQMNGVPAEQQLTDHLDLAVALGAEPEDPRVTEARDDFDAALAELDAAVEARPGLRVMAVSAAPENFFVVNSAAGGALGMFADHGVSLPETEAPDTDQFERLSWEEADKYPADLLLQDARPGRTTLAELDDQPLWRDLPAVRAGQVGDWPAETPFGYAAYAEMVSGLAADIEDAEPLDH
ncbi:ABC transporter substrate-binding protein [Nocardiopsis mangrovi]|uniref:ABC transporter substrate-binding protein n=1 Tax=Nocardiopsis mangrovi TaxID=1179818 RepID=A0ABV9E4J8_9ACTN